MRYLLALVLCLSGCATLQIPEQHPVVEAIDIILSIPWEVLFFPF